MTDGDHSAYEFLPSVRAGIRPDERFGGDSTVEAPGEVTVSFDVAASEDDGDTWSETRSRSVALQVYGPGDVIGVDRRQVVRTEPAPGTGDFPPNYFPTVEFDRPDLPWLFSPERRGSDEGANARARPWCCLVTVERRDGVTLDAGGDGPLPVLEIATPADPAVELPDLDEVWAWAHAEVLGDAARLDEGTDYLDDVLAGNSGDTVSRLVSPRNLRANRSYYACVVPVFEPGRRAGLGEDPFPGDGADAGDGADPADGEGAGATREMGLAWDADGGGPVRLPVYYRWEFSTGPRGDFEMLARRLEPRTLGPNVGYRDVDVEDPGPDALVEPDATVTVSGALRSEIDPDERHRYDEYPADEPPPLPERLRELLNRPDVLAGSEGTEAVGPPTYGQFHAGVDGVGDEPPWLGQLNETPRLRLPAGFGTGVVQDHQEALMADAWDQFGDLEFGNQVFGAAQLGGAIADALHRSMSDAPVASLLEFTMPVHPRVLWEGELTLRQRVLDVAPRAATRAAFRRLTRPRGPFGRRFDEDLTSLAGELAAGDLRLDPPSRVDGRVTDLRQRLDAMDRPAALDALSVLTGGAGEAGVTPDATWWLGDAGLATDDAVGDEGEPDVELAGELTEGEGIPGAGPAGAGTPAGGGYRTYAYTAGEAPRPGDAGEGPHPVRDAHRVLGSVEAHCTTARRRLAALGGAVVGASSGRDGDLEAIRELIDERPTVVDHTAAVRGNTFHALNRSLSLVLASPAVEVGLTAERTARLRRRVESLHAEAVASLGAAIDQLRSPPFEPGAVLADLGNAERRLADLLYATDGIRTELPAAPPPGEDATVRLLSGSTPDGSAGGAATEAIVAEGAGIVDHEALLASIHPEDYIVERVAERLALDPDWLRSRDDPLAPVMAHPEFPIPTYEWLAERSTEYLLPGVDEIPRNTVGLLETNREFVEAFLTGLNHEMARELLWRRYPTDRRGTYFEQFWDRRGNPETGDDPPPDVDPIHTWSGDLGDNAPAETAEEEAVLLVKGELLQRYPNTTVYAAKAVEDDGDRVPAVPGTHVTRELARGGTDPEDRLRFPVFEGKLDPDISFFGFPMTPEEAVTATYDWQEGREDGLDRGWFFVYEETPTGPRFGLDAFDADDGGDVPAGVTYEGPDGRTTEPWEEGAEDAGADAGWDAIGWGHLAEDAGSVAELGSYLPVATSRPGAESWAVEATEAGDPTEDAPAWADRDAADWGRNSAHMARITWQRPVRVAVHADDMLPAEHVDGSGGSG